MKKRKREYMNLKKAANVVIGLAAVISILLFITGMMVGSAALKELRIWEDGRTGVFLTAAGPYIVYIVLIITIAYVAKNVLEHFMRMEIIALDGSDVFESIKESVKREEEEIVKKEESWDRHKTNSWE